MSAAQCNNPLVMMKLLKNGANINAVDKYNMNALHCVIEDDGHGDDSDYDQLEAVELLLKNGIDLSHREKNGLTPLEAALEKQREKMVYMITEALSK